MKKYRTALVLICLALAATIPAFAENLWDVVEEAQHTIKRKYPDADSIARKLALKELEGIAVSDMSEERKIEEIRRKYPDADGGNADNPATSGAGQTPSGRPKSGTEETERRRKLAEQGDDKAQFNLALDYSSGNGVKQDKAEAAKWFRKAAEQGNAKAQFNLGCCYDNGDGVKQDKAEAAKWFRMAAEQGHAPAQFNLALCCYDGDGVKKDRAEAVKWFRMAA